MDWHMLLNSDCQLGGWDLEYPVRDAHLGVPVRVSTERFNRGRRPTVKVGSIFDGWS